MSMDQSALTQELERRHLQEEAANRDTAGVRQGAKVVMVLGWLAAAIPLVGLIGLFVSFWAGVGAGTYMLISGAKKAGMKYIIAGFMGTIAVGILWVIVWMTLGLGTGFLSSIV